jgi:nitroreductase
MEAMQAILERRSVRKYRQEPIPAEDLKQILEAGHQSPSAANRQPWHFVIICDPEQKQRVAQACNGQMWLADAACILVGVGLPAVSEKWYPVDVAMAMENMVIAARSLGYGTCWIGAFKPDEVKAACGLPEGAEVVACTPIGVPEAWPAARERKEWSTVFSKDRYGEALNL